MKQASEKFLGEDAGAKADAEGTVWERAGRWGRRGKVSVDPRQPRTTDASPTGAAPRSPAPSRGLRYPQHAPGPARGGLLPEQVPAPPWLPPGARLIRLGLRAGFPGGPAGTSWQPLLAPC